jgi:sarcosine oxidase subunit alpha
VFGKKVECYAVSSGEASNMNYVRSRRHYRLRAPFDCEKGLPYVNVVVKGKIEENCFPPEPRNPGGIRFSSTIIHSKGLRNQSVIEIISRISNLPDKVIDGVEYEVEKKDWKKVIVGAGISGLFSLDDKSVLIANNLQTNTLFDPMDPLINEVKSILKNKRDRIIEGDFLGKFSEGYAFRIGEKIVILQNPEIIFAVGGRYLPPLFEGNDLPGVISREMYLKFRGKYQNILVLGSGDDAIRTAVLSGSKRVLTPRGTILLSKRGREMQNEEGIEMDEVKSLKVSYSFGKLKARWDDGEALVDAVVFAPLKQPRLEGISNVGCTYRLVRGMGVYIPNHDENGWMECGHRVVGGARGIDDPEISAKSVSEDVTEYLMDTPLRFYYHDEGEANPYDYGLGGYACRCEDIMWNDVMEFVDKGFKSVEMLKRTSGICLGECQGKACSFVVGSLLGSTTLITFRSPLYPV